MVDAINAIMGKDEGACEGLVLNPAAYSHSSLVTADAVGMLASGGIPTVEVHISNVFAREAYRQHSFVSARAAAVIAGAGLHGYSLAIEHLLYLLEGSSGRA